MANFNAYVGRFVRFTQDMVSSDGHIVKAGTEAQVLGHRWMLSFVGIPGTFPKHLAGKWMEPVEPKGCPDTKEVSHASISTAKKN